MKKLKNAMSLLMVTAMMIAVFAVAPSVGRAATTYYVSMTGNDNNPGTQSQPFKTIQKGVSVAQAGDTVLVRGGTYHEVVTISRKIVLKGYPNETAIIDGQGKLPAGALEAPDYARYTPLIRITGDYVEVRDLTVTNSRGRGIATYNGNHALIYNCKVSYCYDGGIVPEKTSYTTVQNCEVWECSRVNAPPRQGGVVWPPSLFTNFSDHVTIKGNIVHHGHGEGIDDFKSDYTLIEDNIVYDCLKIGIYIDNAQYSTVRNNIVYWTDDTVFWRYSDRPGPGICVSDETYSSGMNPTTAVKIYNNFVYNAGVSFALWKQDPGFTFNNSTVAYNTFVNTRTGTVGAACTGIQIAEGIPASNSVFKNNIIRQDYGAMTSGSVPSGLAFSYNNWSRPVSGGFSNANDRIGNPMLTLGTGTPNSNWLKLTSASTLCINRAQPMSEPTVDFFGTERGSSPDIGAHEYTSGPTPTPTPTPSNLMQNPGFEAGVLSPWSNWAGTSVVSNNQRSGSYCARTSGTNAGVAQTVTGLTPNTTYTVSAYIKCESGQSAYLGVKNFGGEETAVLMSSTSYTKGTLQFTTGPTNTSAQIYIWKPNGTGSVYSDDFTLTR